MAACGASSHLLCSSPNHLSLQNPNKISSSMSSSRRRRCQWLNNHFLGISLQTNNEIRVSNSPPSRLRVFSLRDPKATVVTHNSWNKLILDSEIPVLVEFYASWCGPCRMVHRVIDELAAEYSGRLNCFVLKADEELSVAENYDIKAVPVVLLFKNGEKCDSIVGTMPKEFYVSAIEKVLAS